MGSFSLGLLGGRRDRCAADSVCVCVALHCLALWECTDNETPACVQVQSYSIPPEPTWKTEGCVNGRESTHDFLLYVVVVEEIRVCINTTVLSLISL